jgi:formamidase
VKEKVGKEGARTIPGRPEHGGNCDIKNLSRGSKTFLPIHVPGAKFSVGDLHFSQGDGEISFCGAIEMAGVITVKLSVMKDGMKDLGMKSPLFLPGPVEPHYGPGRYLTFEGFSVDEKGVQVSFYLSGCYLPIRNRPSGCMIGLESLSCCLCLMPHFPTTG